jgi:radical SAM superfamily enzyme YgiQ (UPF0313 family)
MKILFITHDGTSHEPLGLEYVSASLLRAGHRTKACQEKNTMSFVSTWKPDFVAFQVLTGDQDRWGAVARAVKNKYPHVKTIFGGPHFLYFSKSKQDFADIIIRGDAEEAVLHAIEGKPWIDFVPIDDLDSRAHPDRLLLYNDEFPGVRDNVIRNFIACQGCPYKCEYCFNSNTNWQNMVKEKRLRYHSPEWLIEDIERTFHDYGGQLVSFQDDIFGIDLQWLEKFTRLYKRVRIPFFAQLRPRLITEDRVKLLKEAGIHIVSFAIESGNEQTRREFLDREEPNAIIEAGCRLLHKYKIKFRMQNMLGIPVKDPLADALETLRFNMKMKPTLSWCSILQAYPGTAIAKRVVKMGLVKSEEDLMPLVNSTFFDEGSLPIKGKKQIERLQKYWSAVVRWPWLYSLVRVLINIDFGRKTHNRIFEITKGYINKKEYWRIEHMEKHVAITSHQGLDRLGGELVRNKQKEPIVC